MDDTTEIAVRLAEVMVRNTAGTVVERIARVKAKKQNQEIIAELDQVVSELIADKSELVQIAQAFEQDLVAQRLSPDDIEYITSKIFPVVEGLVTEAAKTDTKATATLQALNALKPLLSVETVTVLQLIGFNFRKAIGEPLTALLAQLIAARAPQADLQRLATERDIAYFEIAKDPEAFARLAALVSKQA